MQNLKNLYHLLSGFLACLYYRFPARKVTVIGVTGTDGKTTTTSLIYHILKSSGKKAAMITTLGATIGDQEHDTGFHVTNPDAWQLQKYLREAVTLGTEYVALEVTSHGLDQHRVIGVPFAVGVLTNITHEHLDYHKTYENYVRTKAKLLQRATLAIINRDDESYPSVIKYLTQKKCATYSLHNATAELTLDNFPFTTQLIGDFNSYNCLAAALATRAIGISDEAIRSALATFTTLEGRQQIIYDKEFRVMVDFAHTPNAFEKILPVVRDMTFGRVIHVFGCAGLRDTTKRPLMGKASARFADIIILTAEDPRGEPIEKINSDITRDLTGFTPIKKEDYSPSSKKIIISIPHRQEALEFAIRIAEPHDMIIATGKSHEKSMNYDGVHEEAWDETKTIRDALKTQGITG